MKNTDLHLVEKILVPHQAFAKEDKHLERNFRMAHGSSEPIFISILGESRTGKSRVIEMFCARHPRIETDEGTEIPVLYVESPVTPTVKGMAALMLRTMGEERQLSGNVDDLTGQLITLLKNCKTRAIIIDEFNHFVEKRSGNVLFTEADWLKRLSNRVGQLMICLSGLDYCKVAVNINSQLSGRSNNFVSMPRFDWADAEQREEFISILEAFESELSKYYDMPSLSEESMAFRMFCATGGIIGYVTRLLRQVVADAVFDERDVITLAHLAEADESAIWRTEKGLGSFESGFTGEQTEALLIRAAQIGIPVAIQLGRAKRRTDKELVVNGHLVTT